MTDTVNIGTGANTGTGDNLTTAFAAVNAKLTALEAGVNANDTYEALGFGTDGSMTLITASASGSTKGSYSTIGTTANAWAGFWVEIGIANNAARRFMIDIRVGGSTVIMPNLFAYVTGGSAGRIWIPIAVATGTLIEARCQSDTGSSTIRVALSGRVRKSSHPAMFSQATEIVTANTGNTNLTNATVSLASSLGSYTQLLASTPATYGAFLVSVSSNGTPATAQQASVIFAQGAAASETAIGRIGVGLATSAPFSTRANRTFDVSIASGTRLAAAALATTPGTDSLGFQVHGFA